MTGQPVVEFSLPASPLEGSNLIEAGAGTGKTFTIAGIVIRLLLENRLKIQEILVVTYTNAATEELRDRVRSMIRQALTAFTVGSGNDPFLSYLVESHPDHSTARVLLKAALRDFDEAAIFTIHGFCRRTLLENAFESLNPFAAELLSDERPILEEIVQDFWRRRFYGMPFEAYAYAQSNKYKPNALMNMVRSASQLHQACLVPDIAPVELTTLHSLRPVFLRTAEAWTNCRNDILAMLKAPGLHKTKYRNPDALVDDMDHYLGGQSAIPVYEDLEKFTASYLRVATKKGATTPDHPFFTMCEDLAAEIGRFSAEMEAYLLNIKADLFAFVRAELPRRKEKLQVQSFEDLLANLHRALILPENDALAAELQSRYRAALIDEFQDTDPVQYAIFRRIFVTGSHILFLIGDPKQAIYSFRGADLFTYMSAREHVDHIYTLSRNWRAEPSLIQAINAVFANHERPFVYTRVAYHEALPADKPMPAQKSNMDGTPALRIWRFGKEQLESLGALGNKERTRSFIAGAVASEIARLINAESHPEGQADSAGRIAVLVRSRYEARIMQAALRLRGIPNVLHGGGNLFDTAEAEEMIRIVAAVAEPNREPLLKSALATAMLGMTGEDLLACHQTSLLWEERLYRFRHYHETWERHGFMAMLRLLVTQENVRERILAYPDGERRLTNYLHLAEILHREETQSRPGMAGLVKWLLRMCDAETARSEEHELRLESDDDAVRIVTVHKSKGLEYPIVFCPFLWGGSRIKNDVFTYHERDDSGDGWTLNLALNGRANQHKADAEQESLAENLRLFYVALTRAKERCYMVWGPFKDAETSAPAYILHAGGENGDTSLAAMDGRFKEMPEARFMADLDELAARSGGTIDVTDIMPATSEYSPLRQPSTPDVLSCRTFSGAIEKQERIASFTYFAASRMHDAAEVAHDALELPDYDALSYLPEPPRGVEPSGIFAFPKGARAGTFLHDILEHVDFQEQDRLKLEEIVAVKLKAHGFENHWQDTICETLTRVIQAPLNPTIPGFNLSQISRADRLSELEFCCTLKTVSAETLNRIFTLAQGNEMPGMPDKIGRLAFQPAKGYLKGFIDLVFRYDGRFYLVDWKSNHLGNNIADYGPDALGEAMWNEWYVLQYHLYVLALHRYLRTRLPDYDYERHFGGVFYIFLRGVDPHREPGCGIFQDRPGADMIGLLERELIGDDDE